MARVISDRAKAGGTEAPGKRCWCARLAKLLLILLALTACSFLAVEASDPLATPSACASCHEMEGVHASWKQSPHHDNPSGVKVACTSCHLPPREDHVAHAASKGYAAIKDAWVHFFGEYDADSARAKVRDTMPDERCLHCHNNLPALPRSRAVGIVHASSLAAGGAREHRCVACHDALHGPKVKKVANVYYEEADNSFCLVCHVNFKAEPFVVQHKAANIGCPKCHGESLAHADDEDHQTPPDTMYAKGQVNESCGQAKCHPEDKMKKEIGHRPYYAGAEPERKYCTDCHGMHGIEKRQRRWDRATRKLIWRDDSEGIPTRSTSRGAGSGMDGGMDGGTGGGMGGDGM